MKSPALPARWSLAARVRGGVGRARRADVQPDGHDSVRHRRPHGEAAQRADLFHPAERAAGASACRCGSRSRPDRCSRPTISSGSRTSSSTWRSTAARTSSRASWSRTSSRSARGSARTSTPTRASTRRSTCSTCRATSRTSSRKGLTALADFAGGLTLVAGRSRQGARRRHRGVARRARRRIAHPRQAVPDALLSTRATPSGCRSASRRSSATRRPRGCARSTTPGTARSGMAVIVVGDIDQPKIEQTIKDAVRAAEGPRRRGAGPRSQGAAPPAAAGQRRRPTRR